MLFDVNVHVLSNDDFEITHTYRVQTFVSAANRDGVVAVIINEDGLFHAIPMWALLYCDGSNHFDSTRTCPQPREPRPKLPQVPGATPFKT